MEPSESVGIRAWRRRQLWTFAEAAFLVGGMIEPPVYQTPDEMLRHIRTAGREVERIYEELKSADDLKTIHTYPPRRKWINGLWLGEKRARPAFIINWARTLGFAIPPDFADLAPADNTDECDDHSLPGTAPASRTISADELAAWFEPVKPDTLESIFPAGGQWRRWCEHAKHYGLVNARSKRGRFNPYLAGDWFLKQRKPGWNEAKMYRVLAKQPGLTDEQRERLELAAGE